MAGVLQYALSLKTGDFDNPLRQSQGNLSVFQNAATSGTGTLASLAAAATGAAAAFGLFAGATVAAKTVLSSYAEYDGLVRGLKTVEGTAAATTARLNTLRDVAKVPGLGFEEAVRGDIRLRSVGITAALSEKSIRAFGNAIATVGGGKADLDGVILALTQIQSKGKIAAEEINQINERVPQVRAAMAAAFGSADSEALAKSGLSTTKFIEGLVAELEKLPQVTSGARNALDNYDDSWKQLSNSASEFAIGISGSWITAVSGAFNQASRDLEKLKKLFGVETPGLLGQDGVTETQRLADAAAAAEIKAAEDAAATKRNLDAANEAFWQAKNEERTAFEKRRAEERVALEKQANDRVIAAQETVFAARLTQEQNLQRQIAALRAAGPADAAAVNAAQDAQVKATIAERLARIVTLEKELADVRTANVAKADAEAKAAENQTKAKNQELLTQTRAAQIFAAEGALLEAKAAGNEKLVATLERQAKVERVKLDLIAQQGLAENAAAAQAEARIALEEKAAKGRRGLLDATASALARSDRRSAADRARDERLGRNPARAAEALAAANRGADPGRVRREERAALARKDADPVFRVVKAIEEKFANLATA